MCSFIPDFNPCALITVLSASSYCYVANSPTNSYRVQVPTQPGQTSPLLQYFGILLDQAAIQTRRLVLLPSTYWIVICRYKSLSGMEISWIWIPAQIFVGHHYSAFLDSYQIRSPFLLFLNGITMDPHIHQHPKVSHSPSPFVTSTSVKILLFFVRKLCTVHICNKLAPTNLPAIYVTKLNLDEEIILNGWWTPGPAEQVRVPGAVPPCPAAGPQTAPRKVAQGERQG